MTREDLDKLAQAYENGARLVRDALAQSDTEFLALLHGKQPDHNAPAGIVYSLELALEAFKNVRAYVEEVTK